ncbi:GPI-N-acetylgalactosamine transferase PGAP4-like [Oculina patagonica]
MALCGRNGLYMYVASIYISTFVLVLPLLCQKLGFSSYFHKSKEPYKYLEAENEKRTEEAKRFFVSLQSSTTFLQYDQARQIDFSIVLLTAHRGSNTHYSLQVASRLLPQVISDEGKSVFTILNSDPRPGLNEDAVYLSNFIPVINSSLPVTAASRSREKEDYIVGLEIALQHNSTYVLMIEDDALPSKRLLKHLRFVLKHKMPGKLLKSRRDWAFLKLYYPEKWQGYGWPEVPELVVIGILGGSLAVWIQLKMRNSTRRKQSLFCTFIVWAVFIVLLVYTVGRAHWIELRKLSPLLYSVVKAPGCCTPGVLYQRSHARDLANFLKTVQCSKKYPLDVAIDDFADKMNLERYLVMPNMISHIGVHSSVGSQMKHFAEFYLMFKP